MSVLAMKHLGWRSHYFQTHRTLKLTAHRGKAVSHLKVFFASNLEREIFERNLFQGLGDARSSVSGHRTSVLLLVPAFLLKLFDTSSSLVIMIVRMFNRVD